MNTIYQISEEDLTALASKLINAGKQQAREVEQMFTLEEVAGIVRRDKTTLVRWHNNGTLRHNSINLYKKSDIEKFLNK